MIDLTASLWSLALVLPANWSSVTVKRETRWYSEDRLRLGRVVLTAVVTAFPKIRLSSTHSLLLVFSKSFIYAKSFGLRSAEKFWLEELETHSRLAALNRKQMWLCSLFFICVGVWNGRLARAINELFGLFRLLPGWRLDVRQVLFPLTSVVLCRGY